MSEKRKIKFYQERGVVSQTVTSNFDLSGAALEGTIFIKSEENNGTDILVNLEKVLCITSEPVANDVDEF